MSAAPKRERQLNELLRSALVVDPPLDLQSRLAAIVGAGPSSPVAQSSRVQRLSGLAVGTRTAARSGWALYLGVACILAAYLGIVGSLSWSDLAQTAAGVAGTPTLLLFSALVNGLASLARDHVAWLAVIPVIWFLWDRDRADARPT